MEAIIRALHVMAVSCLLVCLASFWFLLSWVDDEALRSLQLQQLEGPSGLFWTHIVVVNFVISLHDNLPKSGHANVSLYESSGAFGHFPEAYLIAIGIVCRVWSDWIFLGTFVSVSARILPRLLTAAKNPPKSQVVCSTFSKRLDEKDDFMHGVCDSSGSSSGYDDDAQIKTSTIPLQPSNSGNCDAFATDAAQSERIDPYPPASPELIRRRPRPSTQESRKNAGGGYPERLFCRILPRRESAVQTLLSPLSSKKHCEGVVRVMSTSLLGEISETDQDHAESCQNFQPIEVMSVDDDAVHQMVIMKLLRNQGFEVVCVRSGHAALETLERRFREGGEARFPAMILMDISMPGLDGYETTSRVRNRYPSAALPIIMVTSDENEETVVDSVKCGANDILVKPFVPTCLVARLAAQLSTLHFWRSRMESQKSELILREILPDAVIDRIKIGKRPIVDSHCEVSIVFTDIVGFTDLASRVSTVDLIQMLDQLFQAFDSLCVKHGVYKVETIGDAYMIVAGHEASSEIDHALRAVRMANDMVSVASCMLMPDGQPLRIRAGVHSGPVFSGVVGWMRPRYCLFGDTVNVASRMESTSFDSCVQVSSATRKCYNDQDPCQHNPERASQDNDDNGDLEPFACLGSRQIKGKGDMVTYLTKAGKWREALLSLRQRSCQGKLMFTSDSFLLCH